MLTRTAKRAETGTIRQDRRLAGTEGQMTRFRTILLATAMLACGTAAQAQDWTYKATLYAWLPSLGTSLDTRFGTLEADKGSSDVISALDMAFMGTFAAQNDRLGLVLDYVYADLTASERTPFGKLFTEGRVNAKMNALSGYMLYRLTTDSPVNFDAGIGVRNFGLDVTATLTPGKLSRRSVNASDNFTDGLLAIRAEAPLNDRWFLTGFADIGAGTKDSSTGQVYAGLGYQIDANWSAQFGWRYMTVSGEAQGKDVSLDLNGALLGISYQF